MSDTATRSRALSEAADWFARQNRLSISTDELYAFRDWRRDPENAAAYASIEATWRATGALAERPAIKAAIDAALEKRPPRAAAPGPAVRSRWLYGIVAAGVVAAASAGVYFQRPVTFKTRVGEQRLVTLEDGSRVRLNTDSKLVVRYRREERRVELARGEAFFEAAHDASRPFVVVADGAKVRALGTKFDVRRDPHFIRVTLLEGKVQVAKDGQRNGATLTPNQQLTVSAQGISPVRPADASQAAGWTMGRLIFHDTPLEEAVAEINRYTDKKIVLDGPTSVTRQPVSGAFNIGNTQDFVAAVEGGFDLQSTENDGVIHLGPRPTTPTT